MATLTEVPAALDMKEIWFTNMLLLGFDPLAQEEKHKLPFNRDMFIRPNRKGMEAVLHYLFTQLNSHLAYEEFRDCWPVYDKKQEQLFRKGCCNWIASIAKEDSNSGLSRAVAPILLSPCGDKFYQFLLTFSTYCLHTVYVREYKPLERELFIPTSVRDRSRNTPLFEDIHESATMLHIINQCHQTIARFEKLSYLHHQWRSFSKNSIADCRRICKEMRELQDIFQQDHLQQLSSSLKLDHTKEESLKEKVRQLWIKVETFISDTSTEREVVQAIIKSSSNKYSINGNDVLIQVPEVVLHHMTSSNNSAINNIYEGEQVNLTNLIHACTCALDMIRICLQKGNLPNLSEDIEYTLTELETHSNHVLSAKRLRSCLVEHNDKLMKTIEDVKMRLKELRESKTEGKKSVHHPVIVIPFLNPSQMTKDLSLLPPSPQMSHLLTPPSTSHNFTPYCPLFNATESTPDAVANITKNITELSLRKPLSLSPTHASSPLINSRSKPDHVSKHPIKSNIQNNKKKQTQTTRKPVTNIKQMIRKTSPVLIKAPIKSVPSPHEVLAEQIATAVADPITPLKAQDLTDRMAFEARDLIPRTPTEDPEVKMGITTPTSLITTPTIGFDLLNEDIQPPTPYRQISDTSSDISDSSSDNTTSFHDVPVGNLLNLST